MVITVAVNERWVTNGFHLVFLTHYHCYAFSEFVVYITAPNVVPPPTDEGAADDVATKEAASG